MQHRPLRLARNTSSGVDAAAQGTLQPWHPALALALAKFRFRDFIGSGEVLFPQELALCLKGSGFDALGIFGGF